MEVFKIEEVELLWHDDKWDGPLSGICKVRGNEYYYKMYNEAFCYHEETDFYDRIRWFMVYELTPEELKIEHEQHSLFETALVSYNEGDGLLLDEFYEQRRKSYNKPELKKIVGIFRELSYD